MPGIFSKSISSSSKREKRDPRLEVPWQQEPVSNPTVLRAKMLEMYWDGIHREVVHILLSLIEMQGFQDALSKSTEQDDVRVSDYDAFINQICEQPDIFEPPQDEDVRSQWWDQKPAERARGPLLPTRYRISPRLQSLKEAVAANMEAPAAVDPLTYRARCLLRAAGMLDIDKLVEYRDPVDIPFHSTRGKAPQLTIDHFKTNGLPEFAAAECASCRNLLRGIMFRCIHPSCEETPSLASEDAVCEDCFRGGQHAQNHLLKTFKHCILDHKMLLSRGQDLCLCTTVPRFDHEGNETSVYPIRPTHTHRIGAAGQVRCRLFLLPGLVAQEKHRLLQESIKERKHQARNDFQKGQGVSRTSRSEVHADIHTEEAGLEDSLRNFPKGFPLGNTHISLMIGPLILENGVRNTKSGVLISKRDALNYFVSSDIDDDLMDCIALNDDRKIFVQHRVPREERRIKACMKQIVGGAFAGAVYPALEDEIVQDLVTYSKVRPRSTFQKLKQVKQHAKLISAKLEHLLEGRLLAYLDKIILRLFDPNVILKWDLLGNHCQNFVDTILPFSLWGSVFPEPFQSVTEPGYLISFVVRNESYRLASIRSKYDIPNGLTEEYLFTFKSGRHDDADITDTLKEYWHDWSALGGPLYAHQEHLPWDCTEACKPDRERCNNCTISQHVWSFPFDSWSLLQLALWKDRRWHTTRDTQTHMNDAQWLDNRFKLFDAQDALLKGAVALARTPDLVAHSAWFCRTENTNFDRVKLGGIHRAQPNSHHIIAGRYLQSYIAPWASFDHETRRSAYEAMREEIARSPDVLTGIQYYRGNDSDAKYLVAADLLYGMAPMIAKQLPTIMFDLHDDIAAKAAHANALAIAHHGDLSGAGHGMANISGVHGGDADFDDFGLGDLAGAAGGCIVS